MWQRLITFGSSRLRVKKHYQNINDTTEKGKEHIILNAVESYLRMPITLQVTDYLSHMTSKSGVGDNDH